MADWLCINDNKNVSEVDNNKQKTRFVMNEWLLLMSEKHVSLNPLHVYIMTPFCSGLTAAAGLRLCHPQNIQHANKGQVQAKRSFHRDHTCHSQYTLLCVHTWMTNLSAHRSTMSTWEQSEKKEWQLLTGNFTTKVGAVTRFREFLHALSHSRSYWMILAEHIV